MISRKVRSADGVLQIVVGLHSGDLKQFRRNENACIFINVPEDKLKLAVFVHGQNDNDLDRQFIRLVGHQAAASNPPEEPNEQSDADRQPGRGPGDPVHAKRRRRRQHAPRHE